MSSLKQEHLAFISPNYRWLKDNGGNYILINWSTKKTCDPNDIGVKIDIYEDRVKGWFFHFADLLKEVNNSNFVILQIVLSYIEGNEQFRQGKSSKFLSPSFFEKGMKRIFGGEFPKLYDQVRCGLFHDGITKSKVFLGDFQEAIGINKDSSIYINPNKFLEKIKRDFEDYLNELKSGNKKMIDNFEKMFYFGEKEEPPQG